MAMPKALPSSRDTSFRADATPCLAIGSAAVIAVVAGVPARPMPAAKKTIPIDEIPVRGRRVSWLSRPKPSAIDSSPTGATRR